MISSEVQRTLVKSPPELWAEISDPESLARHLGEFGQIRITRVQPEQKVEWEAEDASGTVVIKPSGWGTKVKLTVTRELAELAAPAEDTPAEEDVPGAEVATPTEARQDGAEQASAIELEAAAGMPREPEPEMIAQREEEPASELEASTEPSLEQGEDVPAEPGSESLVAEQDPPAHEPARKGETEEPEPAADPKRGFFARLFGIGRARRATRLASELVASTPEPSDSPSERDSDGALPAAEGLPSEPGKTPIDEQAPAEASPAVAESSTVGAPTAFSEPGPAPEQTSEAAAFAEPVPAAEPAAEAVPAAAAEPMAELEPAGGPQTAAELSAEIREAEEVAAEQVTAVLTGVLDRLGAAHHRPFSRA